MKKKTTQSKKIEGDKNKKIEEKENKQLLWIFGIIIFFFVVFFGTYFYLQSLKSFEYANIDWVIENHGGTKFYHGKFLAFNNPKLIYNLYLRNDPRKNNVYTEGDFSFFKRETFISFSPEVDRCREDIPIVVVTLASFLNSAVGVENLEPSTTDPQVYYNTGRNFADCNSIGGGVVIEMGESSVTQSEKNSYCYTIKINNCEDIKPIEKFVIETIRSYYKEK